MKGWLILLYFFYLFATSLTGMFVFLIGMITYFITEGLAGIFNLNELFENILFGYIFSVFIGVFLNAYMNFVLFRASMIPTKLKIPKQFTILFAFFLLTLISLMHVFLIYFLSEHLKENALLMIVIGLIACYAYGRTLQSSFVSLFDIRMKK